MGLIDTIARRISQPPAIFRPRVTYEPTWQEWWDTIRADIDGESPGSLFSKQPHLRTVVTFRARNLAQLGLHVFTRTEEGRVRDRTSVVAQTLAGVDGVMTTYELIFSLVGDLDLYDRAHWLVIPSADLPSGWMLRRLPPAWVTPHEADAFQVKSWRVQYGKDAVVIPAELMLTFTGYSPSDPRVGSSAVEALRGTLQEQIEAALYRSQVWKRGGRVSSVIERPAEAPAWSDSARQAFREDWYAKYTGRGSKAGGTPILEDGMTLKRIDFSAQEQQFVEAAKLSLVTVASAYHVNPNMIGMNEGAGYSAVREYRKMLYGDTLGPAAAQIEARINTFLIPMLGGDPTTTYVEFNIDEKLQGNFEEQADALSTASGRPWMTTNEVRAVRNLPRIEGGDELVTPLNVLVGGQASPQDGKGFIDSLAAAVAASLKRQSVPQARSMAPLAASEPKALVLTPPLKATPREGDYDEALEVLRKFFARQGQVIRSQVGAGRSDWWDEDRWNTELTADLTGLYALTATAAGRATLADLGIDPDEYDEPRTAAFLLEAAKLSASEMNLTTRQAVEAALAEPEEDEAPTATVNRVFEEAKENRAKQAAAAVIAFAAGFGTVEAARQQSGEATKTWVVNSSNPRPAHARMNGETVGIDETFSNGLDWPGSLGPAEQVAGCRCSVAITIP